MDYTRYLLKVIEDYIEKCAVTLKSVRSEIEPLIKELADSDEEYEYMMDVIPYFYRDYFNADKEHLIMTNNNFEEWENVGDEGSVSPNEEMVRNKDVLFAIHNHPNGYCFQSDGDWYVNALGRTKYMLSVSKDGIMIVKDNDRNYIPHPTGTRMLYMDWVNGVIDKHLSNEKNELGSKIISGELSVKEANSQMNKILDQYIMDNNLLSSLEHDFREPVMSKKDYANGVGYDHDYLIRYMPITKNH